MFLGCLTPDDVIILGHGGYDDKKFTVPEDVTIYQVPLGMYATAELAQELACGEFFGSALLRYGHKEQTKAGEEPRFVTDDTKKFPMTEAFIPFGPGSETNDLKLSPDLENAGYLAIKERQRKEFESSRAPRAFWLNDILKDVNAQGSFMSKLVRKKRTTLHLSEVVECILKNVDKRPLNIFCGVCSAISGGCTMALDVSRF